MIASSDIGLDTVISLLEAPRVDAWKLQATDPDPGYGPSATRYFETDVVPRQV
jgi:hypothetical protein